MICFAEQPVQSRLYETFPENGHKNRNTCREIQYKTPFEELSFLDDSLVQLLLLFINLKTDKSLN